MILCDWDAPEGDPGQSCVHLFARILSTSFTSVSIFSVCCYSSVSISMRKSQLQRKIYFLRRGEELSGPAGGDLMKGTRKQENLPSSAAPFFSTLHFHSFHTEKIAKGSLTRYFSSSDFFHASVSPGHLSIPSGPL
jgi:hypothetical protein